MKRQPRVIWPWIVGAGLMAGLGWWLFWPDRLTVAPSAAAPSVTTAMPSAAARGADTPAPAPIQHPIDAADAADLAATADAAAPALPALADSDTPFWQELSTLAQDDGALSLLLREHLIQRLVVSVDNLTQPRISRNVWALLPVSGQLQVEPDPAGQSMLAAANAQRYAPYVQLFTRVDIAAAARLYVRFYPLFQQAYAELGYPNGYFNDRLIQVVDHLLATPELDQPPQLQQDTRGRYQFVDPALESLSVGRKALLRLGPEQQAAVKAQLRKLRAALASPPP
jgi:hypothetical protein